ncbi:omega-hydroxyceramide transacylase-like [Tyto alba]|uniref:omega-hydroxyceramide transacylase-like n=1 Tax=Tyto alba TaxID=56313 RepID=UPI001C67B0A5|nr:omega-hydroxyceramide transacylase-like [Tyto alba]
MSLHSQRQCVFVALCSPLCFPSHPQAITCSCFIPVCFGVLPPVYHGVRYIDGELAMWKASFVSRTMITVSAFAGEYDICPKDCPAAFFNFQVSDCILQISKRNICRLQYVFQRPSDQVLEQFYTHGYQDTVSFLKKLSDFGINYLDEDFMLSLANVSHHKDEETVYWKPETRLLCSRATDTEVTEENQGTIRAADEAPHHLLHCQRDANPEGSTCVPTSTGRRIGPPRAYEAQE